MSIQLRMRLTTQNYTAKTRSGRMFDRYRLPADTQRHPAAHSYSSSTNDTRRQDRVLYRH